MKRTAIFTVFGTTNFRNAASSPWAPKRFASDAKPISHVPETSHDQIIEGANSTA